MGGYITTKHEQFVHVDDKCPVNCPADSAGVCSSYDAGTKDIDTGRCSWHRNASTGRSLSFEQYGPGSIVHHDHLNTLRQRITVELNARRKHVWYAGKLSNPGGSNVNQGWVIEHSQENVVNECIAALNAKINQLSDYKYVKDGAVRSHKVSTGDVIAAENLKYLERNTQASYQDCICYSDCTMHGLSSWTERTWCGSHGSGY